MIFLLSSQMELLFASSFLKLVRMGENRIHPLLLGLLALRHCRLDHPDARGIV
jgi:hypothetical protein